ncbi:MAG: type II and III secretion system protein [Bdellovibrionaceae bacterium]|nr:type II and III secretion system protein [Pseudobdellovibrionaceae bacterium]MDW8189982.1 BON domain-containing protein [Pseudobdellovibrionaceae bacterium]
MTKTIIWPVVLLLLIPRFLGAEELVKNVDQKLPNTMVVRSKTAEVIQEDEIQDKKRVPYKRRFLNLTVSALHDEELPIELPAVVHFKGDYKNVANAVYLKKINSIRFNPLKEGQGVLTVTDLKGRILIEYRLDVNRSKLDQVYREIQSLLADIDGIQIKILNNKIVLDGQVIVPKEIGRIYNVISNYPDQVISLVTVAPHALKKVAELIAREINNPEVEVKAINRAIFLQGFVNSKEERDNIEKIARIYFPEITTDKSEQDQVLKKAPQIALEGIVNLIQVRPPPPDPPPPPPKIIQIVVHFVEMVKDYKKGFLFSFMPGLQDNSAITFRSSTGTNEGSETTITGVIDNLLPKLNWGKTHGYARVLKSGSIILKNASEGKMSSTVRVPDSAIIQQGGAVQQTFRNVGFNLSVFAEIAGERSDLINLKIQTKVDSALANANFTENEVKTEITVRNGQSAAFAGLINNSSSSGYNKNMPQGRNAIISLHADRTFNRDQSQFVMFVTPLIKASASQGTEKIKQRFKIGE